MLFENKLKEKGLADKGTINNWICFLSDVWKDDIDTIRKKLVTNIQDRFIWNEGTKNYVNEMILKLGEY